MDGMEVGKGLCGCDGVVLLVLLVDGFEDGLKCEYSVDRYRMRRTRQSFPPL